MSYERLKVWWEWQACHIDEHGDVQDLRIADSPKEFVKGWNEPMEGCINVEIRLVRSEYTESEGVLFRCEFYADEHGQLVCEEYPRMTCRKKSQREFEGLMALLGTKK